MYKRLSFPCLILLSLSLACNALSGGLPTQPSSTSPAVTATTLVPSVGADPTLEAVPTAQPELPFTSLEENLTHRIEAGEWTLEQGLVTTLKYLLAQASDTDLNPSGREIITYEATTLVSLATDYVQNGSDQTTRDELQRLLNVLFPDPQKLKPYSVPAPTAAHYLPAALKVNAQTVSCATLAYEGFPAGPQVDCYEYRSEVINGKEYELFFPLEWVTDSRYPDLADKTMTAVRDAIRVYSVYGELPAANLVFALIQSATGPIWHAVTVLPDQCRMTIYPSGRDLDTGSFQQSIAHEMFHCFQMQNYYAQMVDLAARGWWTEGTAEYFSNVVYPEANYEHRFSPAFDSRSPTQSLLQTTYENFVFYQYLGSQLGNRAILDLIANSPSDGVSGQEAYLSGVDGFDLAFHNFAKAYLDRSIPDTGGGVVPVSPERGEVFEFGEGEQSKSFSSPPFVIVRYQLWFAEDMRFTIDAEETDGIGKYAARLTEFVGSWRALPGTLNTACSENEYWLLLTNVVHPGGSTYEVTVTSSGEKLEGEDPQCDQCLLGTWNLTNDSLHVFTINLQNQGIALGAGSVPGYAVEVVSVTGSLSLSFFDNQTASVEQIDLTVISVGTGPNNETIETQAIYNGTGEAAYEVREIDGQNVVAFSNAKYDLIFSQSLDIGGAFQSNPPSIAMSDTNLSFFLAGSQLYDCSEDLLLFTTSPTLGTLQFVRVVP